MAIRWTPTSSVNHSSWILNLFNILGICLQRAPMPSFPLENQLKIPSHRNPDLRNLKKSPSVCHSLIRPSLFLAMIRPLQVVEWLEAQEGWVRRSTKMDKTQTRKQRMEMLHLLQDFLSPIKISFFNENADIMFKKSFEKFFHHGNRIIFQWFR